MSVRHCLKLVYLLASLILGPQVFAQSDSMALNLHVPSPDWEDQIIYFVMTDRFQDGDPTNNDQGVGEYDPKVPEKYSGGDIQGIIDQLEYIQRLGATAVWLTPPVANQWWDGQFQYSGYHGYWAEHFKEVDKHVGTLLDYQQLSHHLHQRGMYLIQDIVVNHTGNFYLHPHNEFDPENPTKNFELNPTAYPSQVPSQYPFSLNDARNPDHLAANIYHWTPDIIDFNDPYQRVHYELGSLDDINTQNVVVREVFRDSYGYWIRVVGVDGFRIDTVIYVEKEFWNDFFYSQEVGAPGINYAAKATGRENFIAFGEPFVSSEPYSNAGEVEMASYMNDEGKPGMNSILNFPLYFSIGRVFSQGKPTRYLGYRLDNICNSGIYANPHQLANFIDNHDTNRFIDNATQEGFQQALFFLFTIPGMPVIYMGTEQMFTESRASMFAGGWGSEGQDHFDQNSEMYRYLQSLANTRKQHKVLSRGDLVILQDSEIGPGVLAFRRTYAGEEAIVIFNTAEEEILLSNLQTNLKPGTKLKLLQGYQFEDDLMVGENGLVTAALPRRAAAIFGVEAPDGTFEAEKLEVQLLTDISGQVYSSDMVLKGTTADPHTPLWAVIDGKLKQAISIKPDPAGNWQMIMPISRFAFGKSEHVLTLYAPDRELATASFPFTTDIHIQGEEVVIQDPAQDDVGLAGTYQKPTDASYGAQMDIREVKTTVFGANLQVELTMGEVTTSWLPPNGFDHVLFHIFIDLPDREGSDSLPMLHAPAPEGFRWDYAAYVAGWQMAYFASEGGAEDQPGKKLSISPTIRVEEAEQKITLQFAPDAFGNPATLSGAKLYLTTWDSKGGEGGFREITPEGGAWKFGGADGENPILILDDTALILVP